MTVMLDRWDVEAMCVGVPPRYLVGVPPGWQSRIMESDRDLRLLWSDEVDQWCLIRKKPGVVARFSDGFLTGWTRVTWFPAAMRPDAMVDAVRGFVDGHQYASPQAAYAAIIKAEAETIAKQKAEVKAKDAAVVDEFFENKDSITRDMDRERAEALDRGHRAHDRTKSGIFVGGGA